MHGIKHIVVATDFGAIADHALGYALDLARDLGARVTLFHAYQIPAHSFADGAMMASADLAAGLSTSAEGAMDTLLAKYNAAGVPIESVVRMGIPAEEMHRFADESHADLIVLGTHGRRGLSHALLGSVAEVVVRTSTRPIVVVPHPAAAAVRTLPDASSQEDAPRAEVMHHDEELCVISGAAAGAAVGTVAGPPGMLAGAVVGAAVGLVIGNALDREDERQRRHDAELDREIGVGGGELGAASPNQPPARTGAYSSASAGAGSSSPSASEGPMQSVDG